MIPLDSLQGDHVVLTEILAARRGVSTVTLPVGVQILWRVYLTILEDALSTLNSLIEYLNGYMDTNP